jgi:hypothetical protein
MKTLFTFLVLVSFNATQLNAQQTEKRNVGTYDGIHIAGSYEVTLIQGSERTIELMGNDEDLEKIEAKVKNGTLSIKQKEKSWFGNWDTKIVEITIPVEDINKVILIGSGKIISRQAVNADHFKTTLSGSGDIHLNLGVKHLEAAVTGSGEIHLDGDAAQVELAVTGSGEIEATGIEATMGEVKITGSGDINMYASESIAVYITGSGDVVCKGNPKKQKTKVTGSGDISIRD